jgi:REP element-mobilizing transposase RayT
MVLGYHAIFGTYGFWLPNDPRGSWSEFVGMYELYRRHGPVTMTKERRSLAHREHNSAARLAAKELLPRPPVVLNGVQARAVGHGLQNSFSKGRVTVWACAIMPDHVHVVFGRHRQLAELIVNLMKGAATRALVKEQLHPFLSELNEAGQVPQCWAEGQWIVYLNSVEVILRAIRYVEENPTKDGLHPQYWSFVTPFSHDFV